MTRTAVVTDVHYGVDYLGYVIRSSAYFSDTGHAPPHVCLYTARPTFGFDPHRPNPDSLADLRRIALTVGGGRVIWREDLPTEMASAFRLVPDAELFLELDSDEVLSPGLAAYILLQYRAGTLVHDKYYLPTAHLWRSFRHICRAGDHPRLYVRGNAPTLNWHPLPGTPPDYLYHFGYATTQRHQVYKWGCSAHQNELRPDWWTHIWGAYPTRLHDLHPVSAGLWHAEPFDPRDLPPCMHDHPYLNLEIIT